MVLSGEKIGCVGLANSSLIQYVNFKADVHNDRHMHTYHHSKENSYQHIALVRSSSCLHDLARQHLGCQHTLGLDMSN